MAVIKSKRAVSDMQFLLNARNLQIYSIRKCANFPKRYNFYLNQAIASIAGRIYGNVKCGNSVYPTNQHEAQMRKDYFIKAGVELQNLVSQLEVANEVFGIDMETMAAWMGMVEEEIKLIKAVIKADKERYKDLR